MPNDLSVPEFIFDAAHVGRLKRFADHLEDIGLASFPVQAAGIQELGEDAETQKLLMTSRFSLDRQKWWRFVKSGNNRMTAGRNHDVPLVAWHWFHLKFPKEFARFKQTDLPDYRPPNEVAPILHQWLLPDESFDQDQLVMLSGRYAAYRPHFLDPDKIMTMEMVCGVEDDLTRFKITISYPRPERADDAKETVEGYMLPYGERVLFQGKIVATNAPFIFILSGFPKDSTGDAFEHAEGALLVGASGTLPSAYPMVIRRADFPVTSGVSTRKEFRAKVPNYKDIESIFQRGLVAWR